MVAVIVILLVCAGCVQPPVEPAPAAPVAEPTVVSPVTTPDLAEQTVVPEQTVAGAGAAADFSTYTSPHYGFSIKYPAGWEVNEVTPEVGTPDGLLGKTPVVDFYSPAITRCDSDGENCVLVRSQMTVGVDQAPWTTEISDYYVKDVASISRDNPIKITKNSAQVELAWGKALRLDYNLDPKEIKVIREYLVANGNVYIITFHSHYPKAALDPVTRVSTQEPDMMEMYLDDIMVSLKSFTPLQSSLAVL
jgi:hypothetical protein